jgi:hypothetical protein
VEACPVNPMMNDKQLCAFNYCSGALAAVKEREGYICRAFERNDPFVSRNVPFVLNFLQVSDAEKTRLAEILATGGSCEGCAGEVTSCLLDHGCDQELDLCQVTCVVVEFTHQLCLC